jgi:hypothetical protein
MNLPTMALIGEDFDPRIVRPLPPDQCKQRRRMGGVQPDATMRRRTAEPRQILLRRAVASWPCREVMGSNQAIAIRRRYSDCQIPCRASVM